MALLTREEEIVGDNDTWQKVVSFLGSPREVATVLCVSRKSKEVCNSAEIWARLLSRWYPKSTLLNPDWVAQADLERRLEEALENDYALAALTKRLENDTPLDISDLLS